MEEAADGRVYAQPWYLERDNEPSLFGMAEALVYNLWNSLELLVGLMQL